MLTKKVKEKKKKSRRGRKKRGEDKENMRKIRKEGRGQERKTWKIILIQYRDS